MGETSFGPDYAAPSFLHYFLASLAGKLTIPWLEARKCAQAEDLLSQFSQLQYFGNRSIRRGKNLFVADSITNEEAGEDLRASLRTARTTRKTYMASCAKSFDLDFHDIPQTLLR